MGRTYPINIIDVFAESILAGNQLPIALAEVRSKFLLKGTSAGTMAHMRKADDN